MTKQEIIEGNKLIAEFMGIIKDDNGEYIMLKNPHQQCEYARTYAKDLIYHSSWDWLMPVVEKIESMDFEINICEKFCFLQNNYKKIPEPITLAKLPANKRYEGQYSAITKIEAVFKSAVGFIEWHKSHK